MIFKEQTCQTKLLLLSGKIDKNSASFTVSKMVWEIKTPKIPLTELQRSYVEMEKLSDHLLKLGSVAEWTSGRLERNTHEKAAWCHTYSLDVLQVLLRTRSCLSCFLVLSQESFSIVRRVTEMLVVLHYSVVSLQVHTAERSYVWSQEYFYITVGVYLKWKLQFDYEITAAVPLIHIWVHHSSRWGTFPSWSQPLRWHLLVTLTEINDY